MAKKSSIEKNERRKKKAAHWGPIRAKLRAESVDIRASEKARELARLKLQKMHRDGSPFRVVNRCALTGRPRGFLRKFGLSRLAVRELALSGKLPGVTKASW